MGRIGDARTQQFWDPNHLVAQQLDMIAKEKALPEPACCVNKGNHWDEAILYAPASKWRDLPMPIFWNGPVVRSVSQLESKLNGMR
jgi:hypothetical protein